MRSCGLIPCSDTVCLCLTKTTPSRPWQLKIRSVWRSSWVPWGICFATATYRLSQVSAMFCSSKGGTAKSIGLKEETFVLLLKVRVVWFCLCIRVYQGQFFQVHIRHTVYACILYTVNKSCKLYIICFWKTSPQVPPATTRMCASWRVTCRNHQDLVQILRTFSSLLLVFPLVCKSRFRVGLYGVVVTASFSTWCSKIWCLV